ncbi:two-component system, cell cycle sensor histidine kinase and response regulator CckA [Burkholderiales bacterium]|nr:two-component system, cell cycle sensor histidine kinase and response regulator CckA [Burkholderiales bacterium]
MAEAPQAAVAAAAAPATAGGRRPLDRKAVWLLPNIAVISFILAMGALLYVLHRQEVEQQRAALLRDIQWAEQTIRLHLQANREALIQFANEMAQGTLDADAFLLRASQHMANNPEIENMVWVGENTLIRWSAPFETTARLVGERLPRGPSDEAFRRARETGRPAYSEPFLPERPEAPFGTGEARADGSATIEIHVPIYEDKLFRGTFSGAYSVSGLLFHLAPPWFTDKYQLALSDREGRLLGARAGATLDDPALTQEIPFEPLGKGLKLQVTSLRTESRFAQRMLTVLILGLSVTIIWSFWMLRRHMGGRRAAEVERDRLFNLSLDMLCILSLDGTFRRANPAFERILGYSRDSFLGRPTLDLVHPDDREATQAELKKLATGEPSTYFENRCRGADGRYRWLLWSVNPAVEEGLLYAVAHDITDRKEGEQALAAAYAFRKAMEDSILTGMRASDLEGRITYVNQAFCRMVGLPESELVGHLPPFPYWAPEAEEIDRRCLELTLAGTAPASGMEAVFRRASGERFDVRVFASPLIDAQGKQTGWMASIYDITEQKRSREALRASHERFVAVLDGLDAAVTVAELETARLLYANRAARRNLGCEPESQPASQSPWQVLAEAIGLGARDVEAAVDTEVRHPSNGNWYHLRARNINWVDGHQVRMEVATDITEHKLAEEMSRQQIERLQRTSRLITMGEMASTLAHELNQPLAAIANYSMGCVSRLKSATFNREELLRTMQKATAQAERAGQIIRRVRDFVRKSEPQKAPVAIGEILEEAANVAESAAQKRGTRIVLDLRPDLPPVYADRIMIEQVLLNLVRNGLDAMQDTPVALRRLALAAEPSADAGLVVVSVSDRGHGIPGEAMARLFEPFYTTKAEGMGMGLNICRSIIELHQGRLWVEANPQGGSIFRFTLPIGS